MVKLMLFPVFLTFKLIELPIKMLWWCLKTGIKLAIGFSIIFVIVFMMFVL